MNRRFPFIAVALVLQLAAHSRGAEPIVFVRDILPILTDRCYPCHGQDASKREAELRLDDLSTVVRTSMTETTIINPGRPQKSELLLRIASAEPETRMPPAASGKGLTPHEIDALRTWIQQGAPHADHWAFTSPRRPTPPEVVDRNWPRTAVDRFVLRQLEKRGMRPTPPANRASLLRRVSFDLTGLPPSAARASRFPNDSRPDAYERMVDQLLDSPRYGERMAQPWLDAARYADTTGHAADKPRTMWLYRDWVINALNRNMPFDRFTIEQLAGDMLPDATASQKIATGFHRNSIQALGNNPRKEEFRVHGVVDRLETTGRVWLGLTVACAECHDHKYDPISQKEYYELFAVFNNVPHYGERFDVHGPRIEVTPPSAQRQIALLEREAAQLRRLAKKNKPDKEAPAKQLRLWAQRPETLLQQQHPILRFPLKPTRLALLGVDGRSIPFQSLDVKSDYELIATSDQSSLPAAISLDGSTAIEISAANAPQVDRDLSIGMWVKTRSAKADLVSKYDWRSGQRGFVFGIGGQNEKGSRPGALYAWISSKAASFTGVVAYGSIRVDDGQWHHVALSAQAGGEVQLFVDGKPDPQTSFEGAAPNAIAQPMLPLVIGAGFNNSSKPNAFYLKGEIAGLRLFDRPLTGRQLGATTVAERQALETYARGPQRQPSSELLSWRREMAASLPRSSPLLAIQHRIDALKERTVVAQVMDELATRRETFVHVRGNFEQHGERVGPQIPAILRPPAIASPDRLDFARSLVDKSNPLVARVTVNRIWRHYFGRGLVATIDDFGVRGDVPTHPGLLDWLAVELIESDWNLKHVHRLIVTSATYRQSSRSTAEREAADPENRWLARGPRRRLPAEQVRDTALAAAGVLDTRLGGPSVYPPQPETTGQFRDDTAGQWKTSSGGDRYRRSLYTFWQRMSPYPSLTLLDASNREKCEVDRPTTNTPLQALVTLNDPHFVDLAKRFGQRIKRSARSDRKRIEFALLTVLSRLPTDDELRDLKTFLRQGGDDVWFQLAQVVLNLDEALTTE